MTIKPIFGRIFIEPVKEMASATPLFLPMKGFRDRGRIYDAGESKLVKKGDLIKYALRGSRDLKIGELELTSINENDLELLIQEDGMGEIQPLMDRILLKRKEEVEVLSSGLILPQAAVELPQEGTILAVGAGRVADNGTIIPMTLKEGDKVLFPKNSGNLVHGADGQELLIMREDDILAKIK